MALVAAMALEGTAAAVNIDLGGTGSLQQALAGSRPTQLTVTGPVTAADLQFITDSLSTLQSLDLSGATLPSNTLPPYSLMGLKATAVTLPPTLTAIGDGALAATAVTVVEIPATVTTLGTDVLSGCTSLTAVTLPPALTSLPARTLKGCTSLQSVTLPASCTSLGEASLQDCTSLSSLSLPRGLTTIGDEALDGCTALTRLDFPTTLTTLGARSLQDTGLESIDLAACTSLRSVGDFAMAHNSRLTTVMLPEGVSHLGQGLFFDCRELTHAPLPAATVAINACTYTGTAIDTNPVGENVAVIAPYALYGTGSLTTVTLPAPLDSIGEGAMGAMSSLTEIDATALDHVPATGEGAFEATASQQVTLKVNPAQLETYRITPQWSDFNVIAGDNTASQGIAADSYLSVRLDGHDLLIASSSTIAHVAVLSLDGRTLLTVAPHGCNATLPAGALPHSTPLLLQVTLEGGNSSTLKVVL